MYGRQRERTQQISEFRSQGCRVIWSIHLNGIFGEEGWFQLAEVHHRGIWSIHLSGPSGKESHVGFSAKIISFVKLRIRGWGNPIEHLLKVVCWQTADSLVARIRHEQNLLRVLVVARA